MTAFMSPSLSTVRTASGGRLESPQMKLLNLDHTAIAVLDLDAAIAGYADRYRVAPLYRERVESQGVEEAMIPVGGSFIQLLAPLAPETPVGRFLERNGEGLHHVAFAVVDIEASLAHLAARDASLIDRHPRLGGRGARIAFIHHKDLAGTLIELVELDE
jgi:methylmalonyl-CoA/ethylmalonyl-CoA epimerase